MSSFSLEDTIVAISTAPGEGAIGIVRLSGPESLQIVSRLFRPSKQKDLARVPSHSIHYGWIVDPHSGEVLDEVLVSVMRAPYTYTREDVVEINCHGGMVVLRRVLELVVAQGARVAMPGEFTLRAFVNGRLDLAQAEAVLDIIRAKTDRSTRVALEQLQGGLSERLHSIADTLKHVTAHVEAYLDFPEEEIEPMTETQLKDQVSGALEQLKSLSATYHEGRLLREGLSVAIVGRPNVGKSSLLNRLLDRDRAIVTEIPGTTRDVIEDYLNIKGLPIRVLDTAGIRASKDMVEEEGIKRTHKAIEEADVVLLVLDASEPLREEDHRILGQINYKKCILVLNKSDLSQRIQLEALPEGYPKVSLSAKTGEGIDALKDILYEVVLGESVSAEGVVVTNIRHKRAIDEAVGSLKGALEAFQRKEPLEFVAMQLRDALSFLGEITGETTPEDILEMIFSQFCIGK